MYVVHYVASDYRTSSFPLLVHGALPTRKKIRMTLDEFIARKHIVAGTLALTNHLLEKELRRLESKLEVGIDVPASQRCVAVAWENQEGEDAMVLHILQITWSRTGLDTDSMLNLDSARISRAEYVQTRAIRRTRSKTRRIRSLRCWQHRRQCHRIPTRLQSMQ
jgi:hypothetical protein